MADAAETHWQHDIGNRNVTITHADKVAAETAFEQKYGHKPADKAERSELATMERDVAQNKYNTAIDTAVAAHPAVSAAVLKSLLYQESNMNPAEGGHAYVGIAQLGAQEARDAGLRVDANVDDRHDPEKSIAATAATLASKDREMHGAYHRYGQPSGDELAKFTTAAYNGGAGTIALAMKLAHETGLEQAKAQGLTGEQAKAFADSYATKFENLIEPATKIEDSPLYKAADHYLSPLGADPKAKYSEISHYANDIVARAEQNGATIAPPQAAPPLQAPSAPPHAATPTATPADAYDRGAVRHEVGRVPLGTSADLTNPDRTQRSLVDALGNLEAHAGVPITVSVINTGHGTSAVDNTHTHGHKAGYAADLYVERGHDSHESRLKLVEAIAKDPYVTKVGLGGDYKTPEFRKILEHSGKFVFNDNDSSHVHVQSEIDPKHLAKEEAADHTARPQKHEAAHPAPPVPQAGAVPHPTPPAAPVPATPAKSEDLADFKRDWKAGGVENPRTGNVTHPPISATLDQKNGTLQLSFKDERGREHTASMDVGESSKGRYDAAHIVPGNYQLGDFKWHEGGSRVPEGAAANSFGAADIPITMKDGTDHLPVVLKTGRVSDGRAQSPGDARADGTNERLQGGGTSLGEHARDPKQALTPTLGSVRGHNEDVAIVADLIKDAGKPIPLAITRDARDASNELHQSANGGRTWVPAGGTIVGTLHPTDDPSRVELVTRNGTPPQTIAFKTEELGFTKAQIDDIAARDPKGVISIGTDAWNQPVVNAKVDLDRAQAHEQQREPAGAHR